MGELMDYVKDGKVYQHRQIFSILVQSESDLASLSDYGYEPGTIAHTPGYAAVWELGQDGTWVDMLGGEDE